MSESRFKISNKIIATDSVYPKCQSTNMYKAK